MDPFDLTAEGSSIVLGMIIVLDKDTLQRREKIRGNQTEKEICLEHAPRRIAENPNLWSQSKLWIMYIL